MSEIIGADAVKLAGLQIDSLQKFRAGQLSLDHWKRFNNLSPTAREERFGDWKRPVVTAPVESVKFTLLADLGIITVPADYVPVTEFEGVSFSNPTRVFKSGEQVWVRAHKQIVAGTTSEERLAYLAKLNSYLVSAQGIELVQPYRSQLPKGYWYVSFDEKERLPLDARRDHRVPEVFRYFRRGFSRGLDYFVNVWNDSYAFLSFCDPALRPSDA